MYFPIIIMLEFKFAIFLLAFCFLCFSFLFPAFLMDYVSIQKNFHFFYFSIF